MDSIGRGCVAAWVAGAVLAGADRYNYITQLRALAPNDVWGVGEFGTSIHLHHRAPH